MFSVGEHVRLKTELAPKEIVSDGRSFLFPLQLTEEWVGLGVSLYDRGEMVLIDPETGVFYGGVSPAKSDYVVGW